ncbi:hypothetical protein CRYUN_Cryun40dG0061400 [Craigia yunnanensis]
MAVPALKLVLFLLSLLANSFLVVQGTSWCVALSDASNQALQIAIDYACGSGADCSPIQSSGLFVFFPTLSRLMLLMPSMVTTSVGPWDRVPVTLLALPLLLKLIPVCSFPQTFFSFFGYGSCMYPSSQSTAGGIDTPTTVINNPNVPTTITTTTTTSTTPINGDGSTGLNSPGLTLPIPTTDKSKAS